VKKSGLFFFNSVGLIRPEVVRHRVRMKERYSKPKEAKILLLMPQTRMKPFHKSKEAKEVMKHLQRALKERSSEVHICFYSAPYGVIPTELDEVYPLSQHETALPLDKETGEYVATQVADYVSCMNYRMVVLLHDPENWKESVLKMCKRTCLKRNINFKYFNVKEALSKAILTGLEKTLHETLSECP